MGEVHNGLKFATGLMGGTAIAAGVSPDASGLERLGETLQPVMNPWDLPEWSLLRGEKRFALVRQAAAVAAELSMIALTVPTTQKAIVTIDFVAATINLAGAEVDLIPLTRAVIAATLATVTGLIGLDSRDGMGNWTSPGAGFPPPLEAWDGSDAVTFASNGLHEQQVIGATVLQMYPFFSLPRIIRPGAGLLVQGNTVNTLIRATFVGRWRAALPGELQF